MLVVDTHCHASLGWFEPVERLIEEMDANQIEQGVLVQIRGQFDNSYQRACVNGYPGRFASVVLVDHERPDAVTILEREADQGAVGVRLRSGDRSLGADPLAIWRAAERLGMSVSCPASATSIISGELARLVGELPRLKVVLEHFAGLHATVNGRTPERAADHTLPEGLLDEVLALARLPNVYVKIPGLGEFCQRAMPVNESFPFVRPIPPFIDRVVEKFGPTRLMWGSDFPPVANREGYANALRLVMNEIQRCSPGGLEQIMGQTALDVFPIRQ